MGESSREFTVGQLSFRVDAGTGMLRRLQFAGHEVLRGMYAAVRDEQWGTLESQVGPLAVREHDSRVRVTLDGRIAHHGIDLTWRIEVEADTSGELRYEWHAHAARAFRTNRTGICVLHPAEAAGQPCRIEHADGSGVAGWFPTTIAPHQPFTNIRAITHAFAAGAEACVRLDGEVFEMEDQRNWSDASFKTYCRPLDWPRPYEIAAGQTIAHRVTVTIAGRPPAMAAATTRPRVSLRNGHAPRPSLRIGFTLPGPLPAPLRPRAQALRPAHIRVVTTPDDFAATLGWAVREAESLRCALEVAVRGATRIPPAGTKTPAGTTLLLVDGDGNAVSPDCLAAWQSRGFAQVGTGTLNHFTELNRHRPAAGGPHDWIAFAVNAQVHAFDDTSLLETVTQHGALARHAMAIGGGKPVSVNPILGPSADSDDPRLHSEFAAVWTLASLIELADAGAARATYFRLHGAGGFLREGAPTPLEQLFLSLAGATCFQPLPVEPRDPLSRIYALLAVRDGERPLLLTHTGESPTEVDLPVAAEAGVLGSGGRERVGPGVISLAPRSVWQLTLTA